MYVCVHACIFQPRWIPAKRPIGSLASLLFLTSKELSSWEGLLDFENGKYEVSIWAEPSLIS